MKNIAKVIALTVAMAVASAGYVPSAEAKGLGIGKAVKAAVKKEGNKQLKKAGKRAKSEGRKIVNKKIKKIKKKKGL